MRANVLLLLLLTLLLPGCQGAKRITILVDGQRRVVETQAATVDQVLRAEKVTLGDQDRVEPPGYTPLDRTTTIRIVRVQILTEVKREPLEFARRLTRDESLADGRMRVVQLGANGEVEVTYQVTREDGQEISRREISRTVLQQPREEILVLGTQNSLPSVAFKGTVVYIAHGNAWVMRNHSNDRRPLTYEGDLDGRVFDLSPDGRYLIFTRSSVKWINTLWIVDTVVLGEKPRLLDLDDLLYAQWALDGSARIAYSTGDKTSGAPGWRANNDLYIASISGLVSTLPVTTTESEASALAPAFSPTLSAREIVSPSVPTVYGWWGTSLSWAPDANVFAYSFANQVGFINASTGKRRIARQFAYYNTRAEWVWVPPVSWSPDSRFIAAAVHAAPEGAGSPEDSSSFDLALLARDGTVNLSPIKDAGMWAAPSWSPRDAEGESKLAYGVALNSADSERSRYALYLMNRNGSGRRRIFPTGQENGLKVVDLAWSPDAGQLLVVRDGDLWLYDVAQSSYAQLTANGDSHLPRWK